MKPELQKSESILPITSSINPATGEKLGEFQVHSKADLEQMMAQARTAQPAWSRLSVKKRVQQIRKIRDYIVKNHDLLADIISQDNGKTRFDALVTEVLAGAMAIDYYCRHAARFLADTHIKRGNIFIFNKRSQIVRIPYGVIGIISPWNYPFGIPFSEVIMGLLAGNAVILKVASETQLVGHHLKICIEAAELPEGVFNYLNMPGRIVGDALLSVGINKLFFTGSVAVGKELMCKAAGTLTPLTLELGGNDPMLVCADADLTRAVAGTVWAGFQNCGQSCGGVERIYVDQQVYEPFLKLLKKAVENLRIGPAQNFEVDLGAMTTRRQMETVQKHIADALQKGAQIYAQAPAPTDGQGQFLPAVVLTQVNHEMLVMREETFGPVVAVMPVANMEEALRFANDSNLGLTASVWSRNRRTAVQLARRLQAGVITINDHLMSHGMAETPWGGFKESGIGRTHGKLGFDEMTQSQVIVDDWFSLARRNLWWYPADKRSYAGIKGALQLLYGKKIKDRLAGFVTLIKILPRMFQR